MAHDHLNAGGASLTARRFRCRKGHEFDVPHTWSFGGRHVGACPFCHLDLMERECGGVVEITAEPQPDHVAEGP